MIEKNTKLIFEKSGTGKRGYSLPPLDVPEVKLEEMIEEDLIRNEIPLLPELSEPEVVRHYVNLSMKNHNVDKDFYPLGSCTMKYNPKINDKIASIPGFSMLHPLMPEHSVQGSLELMYRLEGFLKEITGMHRVTLQPSAGSQGELVGLLIMKKYHNHKKNIKKYILIPESAHGTNPASVILAGYDVISLKSDSRGRVDINDLKSKMNSDVAGMMLTQPNTLGLFEDQIEEICKIVHSFDGLMYMDGANLNALIGLARPFDMGFDIAHLNLHKTFSTPHGGGGPGAGPIAVTEELSRFLPSPTIDKRKNGTYFLNFKLDDSIGRIHSFYGNFGILVRAFVYILSMGSDGLCEMTRCAIINANYLKKKLEKYYNIPYGDGTLHEFVISADKQKERGAKALDIAKALLDSNFHAPTVYFPTTVPESIMIEPTESESKQTLDRFIDSMIDIDKKISTDIDKIKSMPRNTPVRRLDEAKANRELNLKYEVSE
ncbi:MAG: glycine dehydrogenase (aminomethyl-transferring) [bacterium TMED198]|nr:MAG: glycine dehydrogenase (aminomethyl-transferring) [bacterium TMED198]